MLLEFLRKKIHKVIIDKSEYEDLISKRTLVNELKAKCESLENQIKETLPSNEEINLKLDEYKTYFEVLEEEIGNQQNEIVSFDNQVYNIVKRVIEVSENAKHENSIVEETFSILCEATRNIQDMSNSIQAMFENVSSLSLFVKKGTEQINKFKKEIDVVGSSLDNFNARYSLLKKEIRNLSINNKQIKSISSQTKLISLNALVNSAKLDGEEFRGQHVINKELQKLSQSALATSKENDTFTTSINNEVLKFSKDINDIFEVVNNSFELITSSLKVFNQLETSNKHLNEGTDVVGGLLETTNESIIKMISSVEKVKTAVEKNYINAIEVSKLTEQQTGTTTNMTAICENMLGLIKQE